MSHNRYKMESKLDWIVFFLISLFCFFTFQQGDILHTGGSSFAYLNGHILDFYDYNAQFMEVNNYLPSTYILFAIWNLPIRLLGIVTEPAKTVGMGVLFWYKLLPTLFYFASGLVFHKILQQFNATEIQAKIGTFIFLSTPIGFFSQFIFGQYDSFTLFFVLLGLYYWIKDKSFKFILFFGLAITFKYTALLIFIPLLLLREKRYVRIIIDCLLALLPFALEVLIYIPSEAFRNGVFGFGAVNYITGIQFTATYFQIAPFIVLWLLLCGVAFFQNCNKRIEEYKWAIYLSSLVCFLTFGLCQWHPQWLLFMVPFLVLGMLLHERFDAFLLIDLLLMGVFVLVTITLWSNHVDQNLMELGIFQDVIERKGGFALTMSQLLHAPDLIYSCSAFTGVLLVATLFKHPKHLLNQISEKITEFTGLVRLRFIGGVAIFIIPAIVCFGVLLTQSDLILSSGDMSEPLTAMNETSDVRQYFSAPDSKISEIRIAVGTYAKENHGTLVVELHEAASEKLIAKAEADISQFEDNSYCTVVFPNTELDNSEQYYLSFFVERETDADLLTIYRTTDETATENNYAMINGKAVNYNLCVGLYGERI